MRGPAAVFYGLSALFYADSCPHPLTSPLDSLTPYLPPLSSVIELPLSAARSYHARDLFHGLFAACSLFIREVFVSEGPCRLMAFPAHGWTHVAMVVGRSRRLTGAGETAPPERRPPDRFTRSPSFIFPVFFSCGYKKTHADSVRISAESAWALTRYPGTTSPKAHVDTAYALLRIVLVGDRVPRVDRYAGAISSRSSSRCGKNGGSGPPALADERPVAPLDLPSFTRYPA